jgi:hypothetical protein
VPSQDYSKATIVIDNSSVNAYVNQNNMAYALVYAAAPNGNRAVYAYKSSDKSLVTYEESPLAQLSASDNTATTKAASDTSGKYVAPANSDYGSSATDSLIVVAAVILLILAILGVYVATRPKTYKSHNRRKTGSGSRSHKGVEKEFHVSHADTEHEEFSYEFDEEDDEDADEEATDLHKEADEETNTFHEEEDEKVTVLSKEADKATTALYEEETEVSENQTAKEAGKEELKTKEALRDTDSDTIDDETDDEDGLVFDILEDDEDKQN